MIFKNLLVVSLSVSALISISGCQCGQTPGGSDGGVDVDGGSTSADGGSTVDSGVLSPGDAGCPSTYSDCSNRCVDLSLDNANCGSCGRACPSGQGCSTGTCIPSLTLDAGPSVCPATGSPISVQVPDGGSVCTGLLAQTSFRWGLCACDQISMSGNLNTDGFNSSTGVYRPGRPGGSVGANGSYTTRATSRIGGTLWSSDPTGLSTSGLTDLKQELHLGGPMSTSAPFKVGLNAHVNGNVTASAPTFVGEILYVPSTATVSSQVTASMTVRGPVTVAPPCDCSDAQIIPVAAIVAGRASNNDNATIGLNPNALMGVSTPRRLDLPCGHYYLNGISASAPVTIVAHGRSILYIGGDVSSQGSLAIAADVGAELDVFIAGNLTSSAELRLGNPLTPARNRIYLASTGALALSAQLRLGAFLYAPKTSVTSSGGVEAFGGIVSGSYQSSADTTLHYDLGVLNLAKECLGTDGGTVVNDAGIPVSKACTTCGDCANQACVGGMCGACTTNADCCAPLLCAGGTCVGIY